ncbi:MAG: CAP domain-containing protein [Thermoproteota archaeon]|nr:CAP domain-containing protein [Thermoproteota archaeon]
MCGHRYGSLLSACPECGVINSLISVPVPLPKKKGAAAARKVVIGIAVAIIVVAGIILLAPALANFVLQQKDNPAITILQLSSQQPRTMPREELVQHVLDRINEDRIDFGLPPVKLSSNQAAQVHAEDIFRTRQISHWLTNGQKPYMTYTQYDGEGSVQQNVAIAGFSPEQYEQCITNILVECEKVEPLSTIEQLQYEMMYNDKDCCNDGHRNNILDPHHTHVSIGIVYDQYYLTLVQNFENNYGLDVDAEDSEIEISGTLLDGQLDQIAIYYDEMPSRAIYEQNKNLLSYSAGELVAVIVKPLPPGYYYESLQGYNLIQADRWTMQSDTVNVMFDLADAVDEDGAYTMFALVKDGEEMFDVTSYSVFVNSEEND